MDYISFHVPHIPESTYGAIKDVIKSGWLTTGPKVRIFEKTFGQIIDSKNTIAVSSCTAALYLAYLAHKLGVGDEVIVPSFTFCSTINTLIHVGATPVFCDIDEKTLCLDPLDIERKITKKTKAIVVVHYGGMPADMDKINALATKNNLIVIEDAAHAFMTKYKGQYIGSGSNTTCFSFYATKNLTTSEGGMITTNNEEISNYVQLMRMHGISKHAWNRYGKEGDWHYDVIAPGYKYNMTDIEAVIGIEQLKEVQVSIDRRKYLANKFKRQLERKQNIILSTEGIYADSQHAWH
jgi:perosamine synthetase